MNFFTPNGQRRWGILPVYTIRLTFRGGGSETIRATSYKWSLSTMTWMPAPGQGSLKFNMADVVCTHFVSTRWRLGITNLLPHEVRA